MIGETMNGRSPQICHVMEDHRGILAPLPGSDSCPPEPKTKCVNHVFQKFGLTIDLVAQRLKRIIIARNFNGLLALLWLLAVAGCMDFKDSIDRDTNEGSVGVLNQLAMLSSIYYRSLGHWPISGEEIRQLPSKTNMAPPERKSYVERIEKIPWDDLKGRVVFKELPNGKLSITVPHLEPTFMPPGPVTGTIEIPGK